MNSLQLFLDSQLNGSLFLERLHILIDFLKRYQVHAPARDCLKAKNAEYGNDDC